MRAEIIHSSTVLAHSGACWLFPSAFLWCGLFSCSDHRVSSGGDACPPVEAPTWLSSFSSTEFFICENILMTEESEFFLPGSWVAHSDLLQLASL